MRRHLYLVVDHDKNPGRIGGVKFTDTRIKGVTKNERSARPAGDPVNDSDEKVLVGLGYHDFEDEQDFEENAHLVARKKLADIDEKHIMGAGLVPDEVVFDEA